ncbi:THAP domain-containing protein 2-like isoform X2 [Amblyomma americanum]
MGGCCAVGCSNHSKNGVRLFQFPRDPERRRIWCLRISRAYWVPSARAELCEAHFEPSQFEQHRADGWKRLKLTAVPSLFPHNKMPLKQLTEQVLQAGYETATTRTFDEGAPTNEDCSGDNNANTSDTASCCHSGKKLTH